MPKTKPITDDQRRALEAYADEHGRTWKRALLDDWYHARVPGPLQQLRNSHGPTWLDRFTLDQEKPLSKRLARLEKKARKVLAQLGELDYDSAKTASALGHVAQAADDLKTARCVAAAREKAAGWN